MRRLAYALTSCALFLPACGGGDPGIDPAAPDELLFQAGLAHYDAQRYLEAEGSFDQLLAEYPASPRHDNAGYLTGRSRYELLDFAAAITSLSAMRELHPDSVFYPSATYFTGRARFKQGDYAASIDDFDETVTSDPAGTWSDNAAYYSGRAHYEDGDDAGAVAALESFETERADSSYLDNARYYLGRADLALGAYADATAAFHRVLDIPDSVFADNAQLYLGVTAYTAGQLDLAFTELETVITDHASSVLVDNAYYYEVRVRVDQANCPAAASVYATLAADFPGSSQLARSQSYMAANGCP